jgi:hypothetical protein
LKGVPPAGNAWNDSTNEKTFVQQYSQTLYWCSISATRAFRAAASHRYEMQHNACHTRETARWRVDQRADAFGMLERSPSSAVIVSRHSRSAPSAAGRAPPASRVVRSRTKAY